MEEDGVKKVVEAPEEATPTVTAPPAPEKEPMPEPEPQVKCYKKMLPEPEPEPQVKCYKKTVGEEATFLESAKDYFNQFKDMTAQKHWICVKDRVRDAGEYVSQKTSSVFGKQKVEPVVEPAVEPVVNDGTPEVVKPAAVESH